MSRPQLSHVHVVNGGKRYEISDCWAEIEEGSGDEGVGDSSRLNKSRMTEENVFSWWGEEAEEAEIEIGRGDNGGGETEGEREGGDMDDDDVDDWME